MQTHAHTHVRMSRTHSSSPSLTVGRKPQTPFGQLPLLKDGEFEMGQSMAISRYLARKYGLDGSEE